MPDSVNTMCPTVFSTDPEQYCSQCERLKSQCRCQPEVTAPSNPKDVVVYVGRETKGRKGKGVTTVRGLPLSGKALQDMAKKLKKQCGSGGTLKDNVLEIQGDHRDKLIELLKKQSWQVKRSGG